jgi:hypothetical protein
MKVNWLYQNCVSIIKVKMKVAIFKKLEKALQQTLLIKILKKNRNKNNS